MRPVEVARYYLPNRVAGRKPYPSSWKMTAAEAAARGYTEQVPGTAEVRQVPETEEERQRAQAFYPSASRDGVKPPRKG
jgi:hypothetical protein